MCELLGMSANTPTDIRFSFSGLIQRGGRTGPHSDGWGIAFYESRGCRTFHDPAPGYSSEVAKLVATHSLKSRTIISHIRKATGTSRVCLENTHPFTRELWGRRWAFAHNGRLKGIKHWPLGAYHPIGTTDSEYAFCWLLGRVRERFPKPPERAQVLAAYLQKLCTEIGTTGTFNMMLSDSRHLFCHCSTELSWLTRRAPFGKARLIDKEMSVDFAEQTTPKDIVTIIATRALTHDEPWQAMARGSFTVFRAGRRMRA
jgi:glutamine amidotransferase